MRFSGFRVGIVPPLPTGAEAGASAAGTSTTCSIQGSDSGFRVQGAGFRVQGSEFRVQGSGFRVQGSEWLRGRGVRRGHIHNLFVEAVKTKVEC